jgi:hypothetical protein
VFHVLTPNKVPKGAPQSLPSFIMMHQDRKTRHFGGETKRVKKKKDEKRQRGRYLVMERRESEDDRGFRGIINWS